MTKKSFMLVNSFFLGRGKRDDNEKREGRGDLRSWEYRDIICSKREEWRIELVNEYEEQQNKSSCERRGGYG